MIDDEKEILPEGITEDELEARVNAVLAETNSKVKAKQRRRLIGTIITVTIEVIVMLVLIVSVSTAASGERFWMFGYFFSVVITDSMTGEIDAGDFIIVQKCDISDVKEGDNILFTAGEGMSAIKGQGVVHKAMKIETIDGKLYITTKGVNNPAEDTDKVTEDNFEGRQVFKSSVIGAVYMFLSNYINWLFVIVIAVVIWFAYTQVRKLLRNMKESKSSAGDSTATQETDTKKEE